ncbi:MAG: hydrolase [Candidatus Eremiobacteraeota bacterium]|nr:hydrolase [Candidatus Eremiobacteraeota bacterium]MBV8222741.1 hydrolase [Candidatus Eremiobacteraeota bacterium]MBV8282271.1 hydrolase [Candidatus Eremiobacteraeota bacterium]
MPSSAVRNQITDHLLTPKNAALVVIDYQPVQVKSVKSMPQDTLVANVARLVETAVLFQLPVVLSTVNVSTGKNEPTIPELRKLLPGVPEIDRTSINAWEDEGFLRAVIGTQRKKLLMAALWTEACLAFPTLDALREGFDMYPVCDAVGGTSPEAHELAIERMMQAGARPVGWVQVACELQRDWSRAATAQKFADILFGPVPATAAR